MLRMTLTIHFALCTLRFALKTVAERFPHHRNHFVILHFALCALHFAFNLAAAVIVLALTTTVVSAFAATAIVIIREKN
mgnify:CR=1 FL=1